jgi:hypothetical protein
MKGAGNKILNTEIYNAPSMGIYIKGNNHTIEYVDIHNVCREAHDLGAIYIGRDPTERGHEIRYCYFHDIKSPFEVTAIYHDDGASGMSVYGCIFNNITSAPIWIGGGQDINYSNNIFLNLPYVIQIDNRFQIWKSYSKWLKPNDEFDKKFKAVNYSEPPYSTMYPELLDYWKNDPAIPKRNVIKNNVIINITKKVIKGNIDYLCWEDNHVLESDFKMHEQLNIKSNEFIHYLQTKTNFRPIAVNKVGCSLPYIR